MNASDADPVRVSDAARSVLAALRARSATIAVAESLTGGAVTAALVAEPGASDVVVGGIVAYATELKHSLLGVDAELLAARGPVDPDVAAQMARGVRTRLVVGDRPASLGIATTGVAGPDPQGDAPPGLVYIALATEGGSWVRRLDLTGDRDSIRADTVRAVLALVAEVVE